MKNVAVSGVVFVIFFIYWNYLIAKMFQVFVV